VDFQVRIAEAAVADFEDILAYSWAHFPSSAERFGNASLNHIELLRSFPYIGSPVDGCPGVRQLVHTPVLIYYRVHETPDFVEVLHF
jgi:plasmid stabilization system protein ParE